MSAHSAGLVGEPTAFRRIHRDWMSTLEALTTLATGMSFLAVMTLVVTTTMDLVHVAFAVGAQAIAYAAVCPVGAWMSDRFGPRRTALGADLLSTLAVGVIAFAYNGFIVLICAVAVLGAVRAIRDRALPADNAISTSAPNAGRPGAPAREGLLRALILIGGGLAGIAVAWLGAAGAFWLLAMMFAACAAIVVPQARRDIAPAAIVPAPPPATATVDTDTVDFRTVDSRTVDSRTVDSHAVDGHTLDVHTVDAESSLTDQPPPSIPVPPQRSPQRPGQLSAADRVRPMRRALGQLRRDPIVRRLVIVLFLTHMLVMAGASVLVTLWVRQTLQSADALGFVSGALIVGVIGGGMVLSGHTDHPIRYLVAGLGFIAGAGAAAVRAGMPPLMLLILVAAAAIGVAMSSVTPALGEVLSRRMPAGLRSRVGGFAATAAYAGLPIGAASATWLLDHATLTQAISVTAGLYLLAILAPLFIYGTWRQIEPGAPLGVPVAATTPKFTARVTITLAYAHGQWVAEVRRGRALLGSRHLIKSSEALDVLAVLDLPGVRDTVETALAADQIEAASQAERMRGQLAEVETRLAGLNQMLEITEPAKEK